MTRLCAQGERAHVGLRERVPAFRIDPGVRIDPVQAVRHHPVLPLRIHGDQPGVARTGASGTALSVFPALRKGEATSRLPLFALATSLAMLGSFVLANRLPFDSFAIAWDRSQILYLALMYLALAVPFFTGALTTGWLLSTHPNDTPRVYAANLIGSAVGCLLALGTLATLGGERAALFSAWLAGLASLTVRLAPSSQDRTTPPESRISFVLGLVWCPC